MQLAVALFSQTEEQRKSFNDIGVERQDEPDHIKAERAIRNSGTTRMRRPCIVYRRYIYRIVVVAGNIKYIELNSWVSVPIQPRIQLAKEKKYEVNKS